MRITRMSVVSNCNSVLEISGHLTPVIKSSIILIVLNESHFDPKTRHSRNRKLNDITVKAYPAKEGSSGEQFLMSIFRLLPRARNR